MNKKNLVRRDREMLRSCFTYGCAGLGCRFFKEIVDKVGLVRVEKEIKRLESTYTIVYGVHTDSEGCTYNSLVKK